VQNEHLSERDLLNFAREELGERKKNKLLEHAKGCGYCADRLLETVREHAPPPGPIKLSWWNWASIGLFVVLLVVMVVLFVWFLRQAPPEAPALPENVPEERPEVQPPGGAAGAAEMLEEGRLAVGRPAAGGLP